MAPKFRGARGYYGIDAPAECTNLFCRGLLFAFASYIFFKNSFSFASALSQAVPLVSFNVWSFFNGFSVTIFFLLSFAYFATLSAMLYTSLVLRYRLAKRMINLIPDWSGVDKVLDVGCSRGLLLNSIALRMQIEGSYGRAVGVDVWKKQSSIRGKPKSSMADTLKASLREGVSSLVTCKNGDCRDLPFEDFYFDLLFSALYIHNVGLEEHGGDDAKCEMERKRALAEMVRVTKPGGHIIIWDIHYGPSYAEYFKSLELEEVQLLPAESAFMLPSSIVLAKVPQFTASKSPSVVRKRAKASKGEASPS